MSQPIPAKSNFHSLGWLNRSEVDTVLQQVDALIMPSRSEAFGLATLEAMRNKRAVIASRVGGLKELVIEGVNGRFIDINDIQACREVLLELNKDELRRMGALGFELFEKEFRWDVCYSKWHALFEQVLAKP